jgi:hypothetical protein
VPTKYYFILQSEASLPPEDQNRPGGGGFHSLETSGLEEISWDSCIRKVTGYGLDDRGPNPVAIISVPALRPNIGGFFRQG